MRGFLGVGLLSGCVLVACKDGDGDATAGTEATATAEATTVELPTTTDGTTGAPFAGVRLATLGTYLPLGGGMALASVDPLADGAVMTVEVGAQSYPGVYDGAAWVEFADVPEDSYRLRRLGVPSPELPGTAGFLAFTETAVRELELGQIFSGRPEVVLAKSADTTLAISATGMTALSIYDSFELYSYNTDAQDFPFPSFDPEDGTNSPLEGATALAGWLQPWAAFSSRGNRPLVDPGAGDDLWLTHLVGEQLVADPQGAEAEEPWSFAVRNVLAEAVQLDLAAMVDGDTTAAMGAFAKVATKKSSFDLRASAFFAELAEQIAAPTFASCSVSVYLEPGVELPVYGNVPTLGSIEVNGLDVAVDPMCPPDICDPDLCLNGCDGNYVLPGDRVFDLSHGNPFSGGTESVAVYCAGSVFPLHPTAGTSETLFADLSFSGTLAEFGKAALEPRMGLVQDIQIDGAPLAASDVKTGVGMTPTISFSPPAFGKPDYYAVNVRTLEDVVDADMNVLSRRRNVASISTTATSVTLPDGILEPGAYYVVQIRASYGQRLTEGASYQHEHGASRAMSGMFTP
jgi:hypothetical protein